MSKWLLTIIAAVFLAAVSWLINAIWFTPWSIDTFFARVEYENRQTSPQRQNHPTQLDDYSAAARASDYRRAERHLGTLNQYQREDLSPAQQISYDVMAYQLQLILAQEKWDGYDFQVNPLFGVQMSLASRVISRHKMPTADTATADMPAANEIDDYLTHLSALATAFNQLTTDITERAERGLLMPRFGLAALADQLASMAGASALDMDVYTHAQHLPTAQRGLVQQRVENQVRPAILAMRERVLELLPQVDDTPGIWRVPHGDDYYEFMVRWHTTTDQTPAEIHEIGLAEVARIQSLIMTILRNQDYAPNDARDDQAGEYLARMSSDPQFQYPDTEDGRAQVMADYRAMIKDISTYLGPAFHREPTHEVVVARVPEFRQQTAPGAYYSSPAADGSRPGTFYVNLYNIQDSATFAMPTLAAHEAIPGHHFERSLLLETDDLPEYPSSNHNSAYVEGWALYAEHLLDQLGYYDDKPFADVGRLQAELFRAARLVVDTGMHFYKWDREQSINYLQGTTGMSRSSVVAEVERYAILPGQATSFKMGMMKFVELRERARTELGDAFDLRDFHEVVLSNGSVPLPILEDLIDRYIDDHLQVKQRAN